MSTAQEHVDPEDSEGCSSAMRASPPTTRTSLPSATPSPSSVSRPTGSTSTTASPEPTATGQGYAKRSPPAAQATPWSSRNWTGSPVPSPTPGTSPRSSPAAASASASAAPSTTPPTRSGGSCSTRSPWSRNRSRHHPPAHPARACRSRGPGAGSGGSSPSSRLGRRPTWASSTTPVTHTIAELAELFSVGRSTVYRAVQRHRSH